jgi:tetratricopeptide (TPR) repeat protein
MSSCNPQIGTLDKNARIIMITIKCINGGAMRKIIVPIFLILTFLCSPAMSETAADWFDKANALWDENERKFADPKKAIEYLNNAIKLKPDYVEAYNNWGVTYLLQDNNELGCRDAQKACASGDCKLLDLVKSKGLCP